MCSKKAPVSSGEWHPLQVPSANAARASGSTSNGLQIPGSPLRTAPARNGSPSSWSGTVWVPARIASRFAMMKSPRVNVKLKL
jgi:hypothetical protein